MWSPRRCGSSSRRCVIGRVCSMSEHRPMAVRIATGLADTDAGFDAFAEASGRAALALGGAPADLVFVFAGAANLEHAEAGLAHVHERLAPRALVGCGAQGVVGSGREVEDGGVAVW